MRLKRPRRSILITGIALLLFIQIIAQVHLAHASSYVGYTSTQGDVCTMQGGSGCGSNTASTTGVGEALQNPFAASAQIVSVGFFAGTVAVNQVVILTSSETLGSLFTIVACTTGCTGSEGFLPSGHTFTIVDTETLGGISTSAFNTVNLATPPTISANQWTAVVFMSTTNSCPTAINTGCFSFVQHGSGQTTTGDVCFTFSSTNPTGTASNSRTNPCAQSSSYVIGASFQAISQTGGTLTQCYGSCGTIQKTNTTQSTSGPFFNQTFTLFYMIQSQLTGQVNNVSLTIAKQPPGTVYLGLYAVTAACSVGTAPFTLACPGSLIISKTFFQPSQGVIVLQTNSYPVSNGQVLGLAFTSNIDHFAVNDTNSFSNTFNSVLGLCTSGCETWQSPGILPTAIQFPTAFSSTIKASVQASITGTSITTPIPTPIPQPVCGTLDCIFTTIVNGACSVATTTCTTGSALILVMILTFLTLAGMFYFSVQTGFQPSRVNVGEFGVIAFVGWVLVLTSFNLLPFWVPVLFFMIFAGLFSGIVHTGKGGGFI